MSEFDKYLPEPIRAYLERNYYARINEQARLETAMHDPAFYKNPVRHVSLFSDHGVVHVRDVTKQIIQVLDDIHGVLIPERHRTRLEFFMKGYGVMVAYLHDIGMVDFSAFGRAMHPEFATQTVFSESFDGFLETIWEENCANIAWRLLTLKDKGVLEGDPKRILREMLAMSNCHSKSKVPVEVLNDVVKLREVMLGACTTDLRVLYAQHLLKKARKGGDEGEVLEAERELLEAQAYAVTPTGVLRHYNDFHDEAYRWLLSEHPEGQALVTDVVDTLRCLRCADALRQRGTVLKTAGNYEIYIDQSSAEAIFAIRHKDDQLLLFGIPDALAAGEANVASSELTHEGNLRVSFQRGSFPSEEIVDWAAYCTALLVHDIQLDVVESFARPDPTGIKTHLEIEILLEETDDSLRFAAKTAEQLRTMNPTLRNPIRTVPSLKNVSEVERQRYLSAQDYAGEVASREEILSQLQKSGHKIDNINPDEAFKHVKFVTVRAGETVIQAGSMASFVYVPMREGLKVIPLGGYQAFSVRPWMPLGNTGVIRGAVRNADIVAESPVSLLMIPKEVYLRHWHATYNVEEFLKLLKASLEQPLAHSWLCVEAGATLRSCLFALSAFLGRKRFQAASCLKHSSSTPPETYSSLAPAHARAPP